MQTISHFFSIPLSFSPLIYLFLHLFLSSLPLPLSLLAPLSLSPLPFSLSSPPPPSRENLSRHKMHVVYVSLLSLHFSHFCLILYAGYMLKMFIKGLSFGHTECLIIVWNTNKWKCDRKNIRWNKGQEENRDVLRNQWPGHYNCNTTFHLNQMSILAVFTRRTLILYQITVVKWKWLR